MRKLPLILAALLTAACLVAMPFLCSHSDILPEVSTAYYDYKAKEEALTASGPEAELMRMLTGLTADAKLEPVSTPLKFSWFGMALAICAALALLSIWYHCVRYGELHSALAWTAALAVPFGLLGARLVYCLVNISFYLSAISAPEATLKVWEGGLSLSGALAGVTLSGVLGANLGKASIGRVLDALAVSLLWLAICITLAVSYSGIGFGPEFSGGSLLSETINGVDRLDTSLLQVVALGIILLAVSKYYRGKSTPAGQRFALYAFLYGGVMILLESLREDGHMVWGFVHAEMVFDLCFALPALLYLARTKKRILLSLLATAALAGVVVALEFALDRSSIGDGLLYVGYVVALGAYLALGCSHLRKTA